jgi:hypothetical protein
VLRAEQIRSTIAIAGKRACCSKHEDLMREELVRVRVGAMTRLSEGSSRRKTASRLFG